MNPCKIFLYAFLLTGLLSCKKAGEGAFLLEGTITGLEDSTLIELSYNTVKDNHRINITDSARIIDGKFSFQGFVKEMTTARLDFSHRLIPIYIEPTSMKIYIDGNKPYRYQMTGTTVEKENIEFRKHLQPYMEFYYELLDSVIGLSNKVDLLEENSFAKDSLFLMIDNVVAANEINRHKSDSIYFDFAQNHPDYRITPGLLYSISETGNIGIDSIRSVYDILPMQSKNSLMGRLALGGIEEQEKRIRLLARSSIGGFPDDFCRKSVSSETIRLSDYKNKTYVLLDFWASWCAPCLKEVPKMKEIYRKYHTAEFTIIGVSLDNNQDSWRKAIEMFQLQNWPQILSTESKKDNSDTFSESSLSDVFECTEIPFYVLIDKEGKVIAKWKYLEDTELEELCKIIDSI